ncbi:MAG: hypothetical protein KC994_25595, partial [Candidatus Omnitrophica bacterium]|nr:hypothetical protein [Candidatus Omnitrophota bacterium]
LTHVDVTVGCLKARRGPAELTFEGPFVFDRSTQAEEDANVSLTFQGDAPYSLTAMISLDNASREFSRDDVWCLYDLDGHRVIAQPDHSPPDIGKKVLEWRGEYFLNRVAAVTYNEKVHEKTFHNVPLDFAHWEDRNLTPDLEEYKRRFPERFSAQRIHPLGNQFASFAEIFAASDILKGSMLRGAALNFVNREAEDLGKLRLSEQEKGKVNDLLHRWLSVEEVMFQEKVIETGLGLRFPEFIDISLDWAFEHPLEFKGGAMTLYLGRMAEQLTPAQFNRMADLFLNPETERTYESLWYWFEQQLENPNAKDAKERLLKEGRVWHWWRIIESDLEGFRWDDHSPEKAKEILNRKREMGGLPLEGLRNTEDLNQTLSRWITPKLLTIDHREVFQDVFQAFVQSTTPEGGTPVLIRFLEDLVNEWGVDADRAGHHRGWMGVEQTLIVLNDWHGLNLGDLPEEYREGFSEGEDGRDWLALAKEATASARSQPSH